MPRRLVPRGPLGTRVYRAMMAKTKADGSAWQPEDLAREIGVSPTTVRGWIARKVVPDGPNLSELARALGTSTEDLLRGYNFGDKPGKSGLGKVSGTSAEAQPSGAGSHAAEVARILADAFARIADLLSADHPATRQSPSLEAAADDLEDGDVGRDLDEERGEDAG